jgi:hypothetical protein
MPLVIIRTLSMTRFTVWARGHGRAPVENARRQNNRQAKKKQILFGSPENASVWLSDST